MDAELPYPPVRAEPHAGEVRRWASLLEWIDREGLLALLVCGYAAAIFAFGRWLVSTDSWFALTIGRFIAQHGLPTHDTLTVFAHGRRWVDQQWLAQLAIYGLDRAGGLRLAVLAQVVLLGASLAAAMVVARRRGASVRSVAILVAIALLPLLLSSLQLRAQSLVYPLFVAVLVIVTGPSPLTWRRIALLVGILSLWANLHGSVVLAAGLVALRGLSDLSYGFHDRRRPSLQALVLAALPWPCLLVTPFPLDIPHYYLRTIFNSTLSHYLAQWQPSTLSIVSLPLFVLAFGFVWLLARTGATYSRFEKLAGLLLVAFALIAVRNWVWLCLFAVSLYPMALDRVRNNAPLPAALNRVSAPAGLLLAAFASAATLAHGESWFTRQYPDAAARAVATIAAAHPSDKIWASVRWGDWLLWKQPQLAGRIAYDARAELLTSDQVKRMVLLRVTPALLPAARRQYKIFLVDRTDEPTVFAALRREGRVAYDDGEVLVVSFPRA